MIRVRSSLRKLRLEYRQARVHMRTSMRTSKVDELTEAALVQASSSEETYKDYLRAQIHKSYNQSAESAAVGPNWRTHHLAGLVAPFIPLNIEAPKALCVGCRDARELDVLEETCGVETQGIDLFSSDPRIVVGDMHAMPFEGAQFDVVYSCHSFEHALHPTAAAREFLRVLKPGGLLVVEVPIRFEPTAVDCFDVGSIDALIRMFEPRVGESLHQEEDSRVKVPGEGWVARLIVRVS